MYGEKDSLNLTGTVKIRPLARKFVVCDLTRSVSLFQPFPRVRLPQRDFTPKVVQREKLARWRFSVTMPLWHTDQLRVGNLWAMWSIFSTTNVTLRGAASNGKRNERMNGVRSSPTIGRKTSRSRKPNSTLLKCILRTFSTSFSAPVTEERGALS